MGHEVFEWVIAIAVLIVFISNLVFLGLIYKILKPLIVKLEATNDGLKPILEEAEGVLSSARGMIAAATPIVVESRPVVHDIVTKANNITDIVRTQAIEISALMRDTVSALRSQVERVDDLIRRTTDRIDATTTTIQKQVTEPVREINYLGVATKRALSALFNRDKRAS